MNRPTKLLSFKMPATFGGLVLVSAALVGYSNYPPLRRSGAPGEATCANCHQGTAVNGGGGRIALTFSSGTAYIPGSTVHVTVNVLDPAQKLAGFELTNRLLSSPQNSTGLFVSTDSSTSATCLDGTSPPDAGCPNNAAQYIEQTNPNPIGTPFTFDWQSPLTDVGPVTFYVAADAADGDHGPRGDHIYTASVTLTSTLGPKPAISQGVSDAFTGQAGIASSTWMAIYGTNLAPALNTWNGDPSFKQNPPKLPTSLNGVSVLVNNIPAPVYFVSSGQVNFLAPVDSTTGDIQVAVTTASGTSDPFHLTKSPVLPAFYAPFSADGKLCVTAVAIDGTLVGKTGVDSRVNRGARPGEVISLYGTGFGTTDPEIATDTAAFGPAQVINNPRITIGGLAADLVEGAGFLVSPGLYQFNVIVPPVLSDGDYPVVANVNSVTSASTVMLAIQQ